MATELTHAIADHGGGYVAHATGAAAIDHILTPGFGFVLDRIELHLSATGGASQSVTLTRDSGIAPTVYDTALGSQDMNALADKVFEFDPPVRFIRGDVLAVAWTNTNTRTWGLQVFYKAIE